MLFNHEFMSRFSLNVEENKKKKKRKGTKRNEIENECLFERNAWKEIDRNLHLRAAATSFKSFPV